MAQGSLAALAHAGHAPRGPRGPAQRMFQSAKLPGDEGRPRRWGRNGRFLRRYPKAPGFPHFYVLEKDGSLLHSQGSRELETEDESSYNPESVLLFIDRWGRNSGGLATAAAG